MKASVAIAIALASSSVAPGKYFLYRSYNTLYASASLSRSLYSSDFFSTRQVAIYICQLSPADFTVIFFFFSAIIKIITRPQLANKL